MRYDRILLPTDLSRFGELAAMEALEHLKPKGTLRLVHVVQPQYTMTGALDAVIPIYDAVLTRKRMDMAAQHLAGLAKRLGKGVESRVLAGASPAPVIAAEARRFRATLLVVSTRGRGQLGQVLFGSVAQKLMQLYPGPLLLLRPARSTGKKRL